MGAKAFQWVSGWQERMVSRWTRFERLEDAIGQSRGLDWQRPLARDSRLLTGSQRVVRGRCLLRAQIAPGKERQGLADPAALLPKAEAKRAQLAPVSSCIPHLKGAFNANPEA